MHLCVQVKRSGLLRTQNSSSHRKQASRYRSQKQQASVLVLVSFLLYSLGLLLLAAAILFVQQKELHVRRRSYLSLQQQPAMEYFASQTALLPYNPVVVVVAARVSRSSDVVPPLPSILPSSSSSPSIGLAAKSTVPVLLLSPSSMVVVINS